MQLRRPLRTGHGRRGLGRPLGELEMLTKPLLRLLMASCVCGMLHMHALGFAEAIDMTPGTKHLFLDDHVVQETSGLLRTMHQPDKRGAVLKPDVPSDGSLIQVRSAPMWVPEEGVYKLVYLAYGEANRGVVGPALAVSKDGLDWQKPVIGEVEVLGTKANNWIPVGLGLTWPHNCLSDVIYDPADPDPARRYKGLLGAVGRVPVVSGDCIHWEALDAPPIPSSDESQLVHDRKRGQYLAMLKTGNEYGRAFSIATSEDFLHWSNPRFLFGADAEDQPLAVEFIRRRIVDPGIAKPLFVDPEPSIGWTPPAGEQTQPTWRAECYNIAVFPYEGVYIGLPQMFYPTGTALPTRNNTDGFHLIQLAMTRDLVNWTRLGNRQPFIGPSRVDAGLVGVFDRMQLCTTNQPVEHGDELWFYYSGLKWRAHLYELWPDGSPRDPATLSEAERADRDDGWGAACLAVLRKDGFVSLDADEEGGAVLTKPLDLAGDRLFVNLEAPEGELRVEILDAGGEPLPGFAREDSAAVRGDAVRLPVAWQSGADLSGLAGQPVQFRFHLKQARLYAFWTE